MADEYQADQIKKARRTPSLQVLRHVGSGTFCFAFNTAAAPLDDVRVRRALVMAVDRQKMSDLLSDGLARPASHPFGDGSWIKCQDDGSPPTDPAKARELIKEYGTPVDLKMLVTASPRGRAGGQVMQAFWKKIGVNVEIEQIDQAAIVPRAFKREFQITPWRVGDFSDPGPLLYAFFHTGSPVALANYEDEELDKLLERAGRTADPAQRAADYCAASRIINQQAIWLWMYQNAYYAIAKAKVKGIRDQVEPGSKSPPCPLCPDSDQNPRRSEMTRWAKSGLTWRSRWQAIQSSCRRSTVPARMWLAESLRLRNWMVQPPLAIAT